jgi:hypothetical protein
MMEACTFIVLIRIRLLKTKLLAVKHIYNSITNMNYGALWQGFSKCFSTGFYRSPAKPLTKKRLPS